MTPDTIPTVETGGLRGRAQGEGLVLGQRGRGGDRGRVDRLKYGPGGGFGGGGIVHDYFCLELLVLEGKH